MKNNVSGITAPLFVSAVFFLTAISDKILRIVWSNTEGDLLLAATVVQIFVFTLPLAFYCKMRGSRFYRDASMVRFRFSDLPLVITSSLTYLTLSLIIIFVQYNITGPATTAASVADGVSASASSMFLFYVFTPAFFEEFFFRSVIINDYRGFGGPIAIGVSSLFFAMLHFSLGAFPSYFLLGLVLGTLTYVTGSGIPSFVIHLFNNLFSVYKIARIDVFMKDSGSSIIVAFILVVAFMASLSSMFSALEDVYEKRSILFDKGALQGSRLAALENTARVGRDSKKSSPALKVFLSPTFLFSVILFMLITLDII